ncbi:MAG: hypothetical protein KY442_08840 [Proteobacteria bacterium]|uniref:hypothetical protein n=1 Tax=Novilysobacter longmucuonensis TaxID=3098603 RepID=UPI002A30F065|nr:hypothetical protein [Pseudomonadota bacterium]
MPWLFLLLALAAFAVAFKTPSVGVLVVCLLAAFALMLAWIIGLLQQRLGSRGRDESQMIDPVELRRLREQAEARKLAESQSEPPR